MNSKINMAERQQDFVSIAMWDVISLCRHNDITPRELYTACTRCKSAVGRNYTQAPYKAKALFNTLGFSHETIRNFFGRTYPQPIKATLEALVASGKLICITNGSTYNKASGTRSFFVKRYLPTLEQAETVYADT